MLDVENKNQLYFFVKFYQRKMMIYVYLSEPVFFINFIFTFKDKNGVEK